MRSTHLRLIVPESAGPVTPALVLERVGRWRRINPTSGMHLRAGICFPERPRDEWPRIDAMIVSVLGRHAEPTAPAIRLVRGAQRCPACGR